MKQCRYLDDSIGGLYCAYWDMALRGDEDIRCYPGGWECYEEPGGCIFEGRWMTLAEYAEHLETKSERDIPEGYELQEFQIDSEGLVELSGLERRHPLDWLSGEVHYLKLRSEYPNQVKMVALARLRWDIRTELRCNDQWARSQWVASLWVADGPCQVDLSMIRKGDGLACIEGTCSDGDACPKIEKVRRAVLESAAFATLRDDIAGELVQRALMEGCSPYGFSPGEVPIPWDMDNDP